MTVNKFFNHLILVLILLSSYRVFAGEPENLADKEIRTLYVKLEAKNSTSIIEKLEFVSNHFIGRPYYLGALGEGDKGVYDQFPMYRTDAFDCQTFVETVLSLTLANNLSDFKSYINKIRYKDGHISYITRNHFTSLDWNPNNQKQNFIKDMTTNFHNRNGDKIYKIASALIDKPSAYRYLSEKNIRLINPEDVDIIDRVASLQKEGKKFTAVETSVPYIPLTELFSTSGEANNYIFHQIPNGSIIEIVRPNWDLTKLTGTHQNISHMGFAIRQNNELIFRNASTLQGKVSNIPLVEYLRKYIDHETIKGINVQVIQDGQRNQENI